LRYFYDEEIFLTKKKSSVNLTAAHSSSSFTLPELSWPSVSIRCARGLTHMLPVQSLAPAPAQGGEGLSFQLNLSA
jgi:hypothetical protein